jgi:hypothetical protein
MTEMTEMTEQEFNDLTLLIDNFNYDKEELITPKSLHETLWTKLNRLRTAPNKNALIDGWKYEKELLSAEFSHETKINMYTKLENEEQRFLVDFWLCVYH